jgi:hypothetical protein
MNRLPSAWLFVHVFINMHIAVFVFANHPMLSNGFKKYSYPKKLDS